MRARSRASLIAFVSCLAACGHDEQETDTAEPLGVAVSAITVEEAVEGGCSTASVRELSLQIIAMSNCIAPGAFSEVPDGPNVTFGDNVFPYLEEPARDAFVAAVEARPDLSITINSMLRTVAQQYLLYRWYQEGRCGISLAATPGNSNHETGLAFDTSQYSAWRTTLEAEGFDWFGSSDAVHFDYAGPGAVSYKGTDVLAFQMLWNDNHPDDLIDEDGSWGPQTAARMAAAPAEGFALPVVCDGAPVDGPDPLLAIDLPGSDDRFADGASEAVIDVFEGDAGSAVVRVENRGASEAAGVVLAFELDGEHVTAEGVAIERAASNEADFESDPMTSDPANPGAGTAPGASFDVTLGTLAPGEVKRVSLPLAFGPYSVDEAPAAFVRAWVRNIDGYYTQSAWSAEPVHLATPPSFGGGRLTVDVPLDVYARDRWEWESDRREGATASGGATLTLAGGALEMSGGESGALIALPQTDLYVESGGRVSIRGARSGGGGEATLVVHRDVEASLSDADTFPLAWPSDGAMHDVVVDDAALAGPVVALWIVPFAGAAGTASLEHVRVQEGLGPPDGADDDFTDVTDEAGCACRAAPAPHDPRAALASALALATALMRRRRWAPMAR